MKALTIRERIVKAMQDEALFRPFCDLEAEVRIVALGGPLSEDFAARLEHQRAYFTTYEGLAQTLTKAYDELPKDEEPPEMDPPLYALWHALSGDDNCCYLAMKSLNELEADAVIYAIMEAYELYEITGTPPSEMRENKMRLLFGLAGEQASEAMRKHVVWNVLSYGLDDHDDAGTIRARVRDVFGRDLTEDEWNDFLMSTVADGYFVCIDGLDSAAIMRGVLRFGAHDAFLRMVARALLDWDDTNASVPFSEVISALD